MDTDGIIKTYYNKKNSIVNHQIRSYDYYVETIIPQIITQYFPVVVNFNEDTCDN